MSLSDPPNVEDLLRSSSDRRHFRGSRFKAPVERLLRVHKHTLKHRKPLNIEDLLEMVFKIFETCRRSSLPRRPFGDLLCLNHVLLEVSNKFDYEEVCFTDKPPGFLNIEGLEVVFQEVPYGRLPIFKMF